MSFCIGSHGLSPKLEVIIRFELSLNDRDLECGRERYR